MRREPDQLLAAEQLPRGGGRRVVLAEVNPVGVERGDEVGAVVDQEQCSVLAAGAADDRAGVEELLIGGPLVAQLDGADATAEAVAEEGRQRATTGARVAHEVEARARQ